MSDRITIPESRLAKLLEPVLLKLGDADRDRLLKLLPLFHEGQARLSECLRAAHPGMAQKAAQDAFRVLRKAINDAGEAHGVEFCVDTRKQTSAPSRLNFRIKPLQFDPCFVDRELPIDGSLLLGDAG